MNCAEFLRLNKTRSKLYKTPLEIPPYELDNRIWSFIDTKETIVEPQLDLNTIVGAFYSHKSKRCETWGELLDNARRVPNYLEMSCNINEKPSIEYYHRKQHSNDDPWGINYFDNKGYINEGNNRTVIAKFLADLGKIPNKISGFSYADYYTIDKKAMRLYFKLLEYLDKLPDRIKNIIEIDIKRLEDNKNNDKGHTTYQYKRQYRLNLGKVFDKETQQLLPVVVILNNEQELRRTIFNIIRKELKENPITLIQYYYKKILK